MDVHNSSFNEHDVIHELKHYLPSQGPLKDFIHHNTMHAFQTLKFHQALRQASVMYGYKVSFSIDEFRRLYNSKRIRPEVLDKIIMDRKGKEAFNDWKEKILSKHYQNISSPRIGALRANWKSGFQIDMDSIVQPVLFRV